MFLPTNITLKFGDAGDFVSELQRRLAVVKCFPDSMVNGFFDGNTAGGVSRFQTMVGIKADGIAGPETLRRLNAALSGDYSGGANDDSANQHAEEEERKRREAEEMLRLQQLQEQERAAALARERQAELQQQVATSPSPPPPAPPAYEPPPAPPQAYTPPPAPAAPAPPPPNGPSAAEMLANMLASSAPQQQPQQQPQRAATPSAEPQPVTPQPYAQPLKPPPQQAYELPPEALQEQQVQARGGVLARAGHYANELIGKLAAYFESKLPRHVIEEVKQIGHAMASGGVREAPIPTTPEQQRDRGTEQQRGAQQGRQVG